MYTRCERISCILSCDVWLCKDFEVKCVPANWILHELIIKYLGFPGSCVKALSVWSRE